MKGMKPSVRVSASEVSLPSTPQVAHRRPTPDPIGTGVSITLSDQ